MCSTPQEPRAWVESKLYSGLRPADRHNLGITEADWRTFLNATVTPRLSSGLSVVGVCGQWQGKGQMQAERLRSKMLIFVHADSAENGAKIEAIGRNGSRRRAMRAYCGFPSLRMCCSDREPAGFRFNSIC